MRFRFLQHSFEPDTASSFPSDLPEWTTDVRRFAAFWFSNEPFWESWTSGSTGQPQKIRLSREQMEFSARISLNYFGFTSEKDGFALALPASAAGGFMLLARAFLADIDVLLLPPSGIVSSGINFPSDKKWFLPLLPLQLFDFLSRPDSAALSTRLSGILLGGGMLDEKLLPAISRLSCPVFHSYGMTETASHIAMRKVFPEKEDGFRPLPGIQVRTGENDCLEINAGVLTNNLWLITRDRAEISSDKSFRILGRADFTLNSGGLKLQPELEKQELQKLFPPVCSEFDLLGIPDHRLGEKMVMAAYFPESHQLEIQFILSGITDPQKRRRLPKAVFYFPEGPPRLAGGKTNFPALRKKILDILASEK